MHVEDDGRWWRDQFSKVTHSSSAPSPPLYDEDGGGRGVDDDDDDNNNGDMLIQSTHKSLPSRWSRSAFIQMLITLKAKITMNSMFITECICEDLAIEIEKRETCNICVNEDLSYR